jgi:hypothetical protein
VIGELLGSLVVVAVAGLLVDKGRRRRLARDDAAGRPLEFPGSILGRTSYSHPPGGLLRLDGTTLTWLTGKGGMSFPVPVERLEVRGLAEPRASEAFHGGRNVAVVCDDAGAAVRIVLFHSDLHYLARAVPGVRPWIEPGGRGGGGLS